MVASKCFSAFSIPHRKKDLQDVVGALDQKIVEIQNIIALADQIFISYGEDARSDRFSEVYKYLTEELIPNYGGGVLEYLPEEE